MLCLQGALLYAETGWGTTAEGVVPTYVCAHASGTSSTSPSGDDDRNSKWSIVIITRQLSDEINYSRNQQPSQVRTHSSACTKAYTNTHQAILHLRTYVHAYVGIFHIICFDKCVCVHVCIQACFACSLMTSCLNCILQLLLSMQQWIERVSHARFSEMFGVPL